VSAVNTGTYSAFSTTFGMKMYYFFVSCKERRRPRYVKASGFKHEEKPHPVPTGIPPVTVHTTDAPKVGN